MVVKTDVYASRRNFAEKIALYRIFLGLWAKYFMLFAKELSAVLSRLYSACSEDLFEENQNFRKDEGIFANPLSKIFSESGKFFSAGLSTLKKTCEMKIYWIEKYFKKHF